MPLISDSTLKGDILSIASDAGFINPRILAPFSPELLPGVPPNYQEPSPSLLVTALPYGNQSGEEYHPDEYTGIIAPFARRNYYREAVKQLQGISLELRWKYGGEKSSCRIFCNSPVPEKPLAELSGLGCMGKNGLIITKPAGSLVILAAMTLPFELEPDKPELARFDLCQSCNEHNPPCKTACPTGAPNGDGTITIKKCIQWYASGNGTRVPGEVIAHWKNRLYGCTHCQDACPHNRQPIGAAKTGEGILPAALDAREILKMTDDEIKAFFKGTAMGLSWLGPRAIRRNALIILGKYRENSAF